MDDGSRFDVLVHQMANGPNHTAVISTEGQLFTFGKTEYGILGRPGKGLYPGQVELDGVKAVQCGEDFTVALTFKGEVYSWGWGGGGKSWIKQKLMINDVGMLGYKHNGIQAKPR